MSYKKGYVPPSGLLSAVEMDTISSFNKKYDNTPIRMGCIVKIYEEQDENNTSKSVVQYDVVTEQQNIKGSTYATYPRCIALDGIGGIGDFFEYKLRTSTNESFQKTHQFKKQNGSLVLLLCLDGFSEKAVIIGGVKHPNRKTTLTEESGLHLEGEYNGLNWQVNKDGELTLTFKSKTNNEGEPQDEKSGGSYFKMDKEGSFEANTSLEGEEETFLKIDKTNKNIDNKAGANINLTSKENTNIKAEANIEGSAQADISFLAEGSAKYTAQSTLTIEGTSVVKINGGDVLIEAQNGTLVKSTQVLVDSPTILLGPSALPAVILPTAFVGTGNLSAPVISFSVGPYSNSVFIS